MTFVDTILAKMPAGMTMPAAVETVMRRMEAEGFLRDAGENASLDLFPGAETESLMGFVDDGGRFMDAWAEVEGKAEHVFVFVATGGDGSRAGIWRDPDGRQHFVHMGSGSGSTWSGIVTDDAATFLRLLAVGYDEIAFPEALAVPPLQAWLADAGYATMAEYEAERAAGDTDLVPPPLPEAFRRIVAEVTGLPIPATGAEIVPPPYPDLDGDRADPFNRWLDDDG